MIKKNNTLPKYWRPIHFQEFRKHYTSKYLLNNTHVYYQKDFSDHHIFSIEDLNEIKNLFHNISSKRKIILTTEKDAVRLTKFTTELEDIPLYVLPIKHRFLFEEGEQFNSQILSFVSNFTFNPNL